MKKIYFLMVAVVLGVATASAQSDPLANGLAAVAEVAGEVKAPAGDSIANAKGVTGDGLQVTGDGTQVTGDGLQVTGDGLQVTGKEVPLWKQKLYFGYNFDIYYHHDSRSDRKENGWSIALSPEVGWKLKERIYLGLRLSGSYANTTTTYSMNLLDTAYNSNLRVHHGTWEVAPYMRYRLKTLFDGKVGIWIEGRVFTGMEFPRVSAGEVKGTDYDGLRYSVNYGLQVSPVITYQFSKKKSFQVFFSILSLGYSGTSFFYQDPETGARHTEHTQDVIVFSGKLSNLLANQFTPGLYGLKFGVQRSF